MMQITNNKIRTKAQNSRLHGFINKLGVDAQAKSELVFRYTNGRSKSSADLTVAECDALIADLAYEAENDFLNGDTMRKKVLSYAHQLEWYIQGTDKLDYARINSFCLNSSKAKRTLNAHSCRQLPALVTQFEMLVKHKR